MATNKKWGVNIDKLAASNIKNLINDPAAFKAKAETANMYLDELAKARKTKQSLPAVNAKKYLKKKGRFETDISKIKPQHQYAYAHNLIYFTEHPASQLSNLLEMQAQRKDNFIHQVVTYTDASPEDKKVLEEYLRSLSDREMKRIVDFYEPILNKGLKRDSDEKFQFIGNDIIQKANNEDIKAGNEIGQQLLGAAKDVTGDVKAALNFNPERFIYNQIMGPVAELADEKLYDFYVSTFEPDADMSDPEVIARFEAAKAALTNIKNPVAAFTSYVATQSSVLYREQRRKYNAMIDEAFSIKAEDPERAEQLFKAAQDYKDKVLANSRDIADYDRFTNAITKSITEGELGNTVLQFINKYGDPSDDVKKYIKNYGLEAREELDNIQLTDAEKANIDKMLGSAAEVVKKDNDLSGFFIDDVPEDATSFVTETLTDEAIKAYKNAKEDKKDKKEEDIEKTESTMKVAGAAVTSFVKGLVMSGGNVAAGLTEAAKGALKTGVNEYMKPNDKAIKRAEKKRKRALENNTIKADFKKDVVDYRMHIDPSEEPDSAKQFGKALNVPLRDPMQVKKHPKKKKTGLTIEKLKKTRGIYK